MRWFPLLVVMLAPACDRDELDELRPGPGEELEGLPSSDHGTVAQELGFDEAREALEAGDYDAFLLQIGRHLESMEKWATTFESDIYRGDLRGGPEVQGAFEAWKGDYARARQQHAELQQADAVPKDAAETLYERVEGLAVDVREISALRRAQLGGA